MVVVNSNSTYEIVPPNISEETKREMVNFFWNTSIPRILADMKRREGIEIDLTKESMMEDSRCRNNGMM